MANIRRFHPGMYIKETLEAMEMTAREFSARTGIYERTLSAMEMEILHSILRINCLYILIIQLITGQIYKINTIFILMKLKEKKSFNLFMIFY